MPPLPPGEHDLQDMALRFARAEGHVLAQLALAAEGDRARAMASAIAQLTGLRQLDHRSPVVTAYLHAHPRGDALAVKDLAGSLARRLDTGAQVAADSVRATFRTVTPDTIPDHVTSAVTAHVDRQGNHWTLGAWAAMNTLTVGRQATSRGLTDRHGNGNTVTVNVGDCQWCQSHAGDAVIGTDPLPPYHPNCSCTATAA